VNREEMLHRMTKYCGDAISVVARKNHDYASENNPFSNFELAGYITQFFAQRDVPPEVLSFVQLIGTKLARLAELQYKTPMNEGVADTFMDLINYVNLWHAWWETQEEKNG